MLDDEQHETIILFVDAITALCAPSQNAGKLDELQEQVDVFHWYKWRETVHYPCRYNKDSMELVCFILIT